MNPKAMKNKYEDYCYVCGDLVLEEQDIVEQHPRNSGDTGFGPTKWMVRHSNCPSSLKTKNNNDQHGDRN